MNTCSTRWRRAPAAARFDTEAVALQAVPPGGDISRSTPAAAIAQPHRLRRPVRHARARTSGVTTAGTRRRDRLPCQRHDPDLWFAEDPATLEQAKALCADCPVRAACLAGAIERREPTGVWGGQIFDGGRIIPFKRPRGRPRADEKRPA